MLTQKVVVPNIVHFMKGVWILATLKKWDIFKIGGAGETEV